VASLQEVSARAAGSVILRRVAPAAVLTLAAVLRLSGLQHDGMWSDECLTANWAQLPWRQTLNAAALDNNAPLYFLIARVPAWFHPSGELPWRVLPALLGVATVGAVLLAGWRMLSPGAGLVAAFLLAITPLHVHYSREARNYSLLMLLAIAAFVAAGKVRQGPGRGRWLALAATVAAMLYTHPIGAFAVAGVVIAWALPPFERAAAGRLATAVLCGVLVFSPWVPSLLRQNARSARSYSWNESPFEREFPWQIPLSLAALSPGSLAPTRNHLGDVIPQARVSAGLVAALALLAVARRRNLARPDLPLRLAVAALLPLALLLVVSLAGPRAYVVGRTDVTALPFVVLLAAAGVMALPAAARPLAALAFAGLAALPLQALFLIDTRSQEKFIVALLADHRAPGEPVIATTMAPCLQFYGGLRVGGDLIAFTALPAPTADWIDWPAHPSERWPEEAAAAVRAARAHAPPGRRARVWVISNDDAVGRVLTRALGASLIRLGAIDLHYLGLTLGAWGVPPGDAPPG
jgi:mannosyltransferase